MRLRLVGRASAGSRAPHFRVASWRLASILVSLTDSVVRNFYHPNSTRLAAVGVLFWKVVCS